MFFPPNRNLSNNLSWRRLIRVIRHIELSPKKENESTIFPRLLTPSDTARNNYQKTPHNNPDPPMKITFFFQPRLKYPIRLIRFPLILGITFEELEFHSPTIPLSPVIRIDLYIWWPLISPSLICPPLAQPRRRHLWKTQIQLTSFDTFGGIRNNQSYSVNFSSNAKHLHAIYAI